jgi:hypothetical protein
MFPPRKQATLFSSLYLEKSKKIKKEEAELFIRSILNKKLFYNQKSLSHLGRVL